MTLLKMSISHPSSIDSQFEMSTLPKSKSRFSSYNINSLYEIEYVPSGQLHKNYPSSGESIWILWKKLSAFLFKGICKLIKPSSNQKVMEYVQSRKFSSC